MSVFASHKRKGEMIDGCWVPVLDSKKGTIFSRKDDGHKITAESYTEHTLPRIVHLIGRNPKPDAGPIRFMQDNAPPYKTIFQLAFLHSHEIELISRSFFSPDLNQKQIVWCMKKSQTQARQLEPGRGDSIVAYRSVRLLRRLRSLLRRIIFKAYHEHASKISGGC